AQQWHGFALAGTMFSLSLVESLLNQAADYRLLVLALQIRACLTGAVYRHLLQTTSTASSAGQLLTIMSTDTQRVFETVKSVSLFWIAPVQIAGSVWLLW